MFDERVCQGYRVIDSIRVGDTEVVLAHNPNAPSPYVTWKSYAVTNFQSFEHGNYFVDKAAAWKDLIARVESAREFLPPDRQEKKNQTAARENQTVAVSTRAGRFFYGNVSQIETHFGRKEVLISTTRNEWTG